MKELDQDLGFSFRRCTSLILPEAIGAGQYKTSNVIQAEMTELGLNDFENEEDCAERQERMLKGLARYPNLEKTRQHFAGCTAEYCGKQGCSAACHFGVRRERHRWVTAGVTLLDRSSGPLLSATVFRRRWELGEAELFGCDVDVLKQWVEDRLRKLPRYALLGGVDLSLNIELNGTRRWAPHLHLVTRGVEPDSLKLALAYRGRYPERHKRALVVKPVADLPGALAYASKRFDEQRIAYVAKSGRCNRRHLPLDNNYKGLIDAWRATMPVAAPYFMLARG